MKPTSHSAGRKSSSDATENLSRQFPVIDSSYQTVTLDGFRGGCANSCQLSFRNISNDYFKTEARKSFVTEASFFAIIIVTTVWPVLQSAQAMTHLVRAFAGV